MELLFFALPSLLVAVAYMVPVTGAQAKLTHSPSFGLICGCKR